MAPVAGGLPSWQLVALKSAEAVQGMNVEQERAIAVAMARDGLSYAQAVAKYAPKAATAVVTAKQASIAGVVNTKGARNPQFTELVR